MVKRFIFKVELQGFGETIWTVIPISSSFEGEGQMG